MTFPLVLVGPSNHQLWKDVGHTGFALRELLGKRQGLDYSWCSDVLAGEMAIFGL